MNLDQLRALCEVVTLGSFTAAARRLSLSQPAISLQIRELEQRFGFKLVERVGKRAYATPPGRDLIEHARRLLDGSEQAAAAMRRYREGWMGRVHLGTSGTALIFLLPPVLRDLRERHPDIELAVTTGTTTGVVEGIVSNAIDLGFVTLPVDERLVEATPVRTEPLVAVLPAGTRDVPEVVTPGYLARHTLIMEHARANIKRLVVEWFNAEGHAPRAAMELDSVPAIRSAVEVGLGASVLPLVAAPDAASGCVVRPLQPRIDRTLAIVQRRGKPDDTARGHVREALLTLGRN